MGSTCFQLPPGSDAEREMLRIADSGERRTFATGAQRDRGQGEEKRYRRYDLLPREALHAFAMHMGRGAEKYQARNWEKGMPLSEYYNSAVDHLLRLAEGYTDEAHDAAALWNIACLIATRRRIERGLLPAELDDLQRLPPDRTPGF